MTKILILLTNHATLGPEKEPNGTYSPEFTHAVSEFQKAGMPFDLASPQGGPVPFYGQDSDDATDTAVHADSGVQAQLATTMAVKDVDPVAYDAIFYPGGFGLLYDLATDATAAGITAEVYARGGVVGAVCHGPAGFLPVTLSDGSALLDGKSVTGFTREEEIDFETIDKIPFLLEEALTRKAGVCQGRAVDRPCRRPCWRCDRPESGLGQWRGESDDFGARRQQPRRRLTSFGPTARSATRHRSSS